MGTDGDAVLPLKWEDPAHGGTETDDVPSELNPWEDRVACRGLWVQKASPDATIRKDVGVGRDGSGNLIFLDEANTAKTLSDLVAGTGGLTEEGHKSLRQLIHFIDDGPAEGFASGSYREVATPGPFPDVITWYTASDKTKKIVDLTLTWDGVKVTQERWRMYGSDGSTVIVTVTDSISYSGIFETSRTRSIS